MIVEIRGHSKQFSALGIIFPQQVVQHRLSQQPHLHLKRNRLGVERDGAHEGLHLPGGLNSDLLRTQGPLETLPGERFRKQLAGLQDQVPAVSPMERARLDQIEIGYPGPHLRRVLHPAQQVLIGRVVFLNHRRTAGTAVINKQVYPVAAEGRSGLASRHQPSGAKHLPELGRIALVDNLPHVLNDVLLDRRQMLLDLRKALILGREIADQRANRQIGHLAVEPVDLFAQFSLPAGNIEQELLKLLLKLCDILFKLPPAFLRQPLEFFRGDHLPVAHRRDGQSRRSLQHGQLAGLSFLAQLRKRSLLPLAERLLHFMHPGPIFLALECRRQDIFQVFCETFHVLAELDPPPGGELQGSGGAWLFKVVYVAPFGGDRPIGRRGLEGLQDQVTLPDPFRTQRENVVAFLPDPDTELHRLDRSGLPDEVPQMLELFGSLELELIRIAALA